MTPNGPTPEPPELEDPIRQAIAGAGLTLPPVGAGVLIHGLAVHLAMTLKWSRSMSLTAITDPGEAIRLHVLESLQASAHVRPESGALLDIGSGNGYPALPVAMAHPGMEVTLLEPALRKSVFLETVGRAAGLKGLKVLRERIDRPEDLERYPGTGTITMRAVKVVDQVLAGSRRVIPPGGRVILALGMARALSIAQAPPEGLAALACDPVEGRKDGAILVLERR